MIVTQTVTEVWATREVTWDGVTGSFPYAGGPNGQVLVDEVGGGAGRVGQCSAMEFECPDAGPAVTQPYYVRTGGVPGMRIGRPGTIFGRSWFKRLKPALARAA